MKWITPAFLIGLMAVVMVVGAAASLLIAIRIRDPLWQGFWAGISTTCVGVVLTVFFVDRILLQAAERRRASLDHHIGQRIKRTALIRTNSLVNLLTEAFYIVTRLLISKDFAEDYTPPNGWEESANDAIDNLYDGLSRLDDQGWGWLRDALDKTADDYEKVINFGADGLDPETLHLVWRTEVCASNAVRLISSTEKGLVQFFPGYRTRMDVPISEFMAAIEDNIRNVMKNNLQLLRKT